MNGASGRAMIGQVDKEAAACKRSAILFDKQRKVIHVSPIQTTWSEFKATFALSD